MVVLFLFISHYALFIFFVFLIFVIFLLPFWRMNSLVCKRECVIRVSSCMVDTFCTRFFCWKGEGAYFHNILSLFSQELEGLPMKDVRSHDVCLVRAFCRQERFSDANVRTFWCWNLWCVHTDKGGWRIIFRGFVRTSFTEAPYA